MRKVIVNTTPLIALADIGHLDLLRKLYTEVMMPSAVDYGIKRRLDYGSQASVGRVD